MYRQTPWVNRFSCNPPANQLVLVRIPVTTAIGVLDEILAVVLEPRSQRFLDPYSRETGYTLDDMTHWLPIPPFEEIK